MSYNAESVQSTLGVNCLTFVSSTIAVPPHDTETVHYLLFSSDIQTCHVVICPDLTFATLRRFVFCRPQLSPRIWGNTLVTLYVFQCTKVGTYTQVVPYTAATHPCGI
jgi:hypothetical protein